MPNPFLAAPVGVSQTMPLVVVEIGFGQRSSTGLWWDGLEHPENAVPPVRCTFASGCGAVTKLLLARSGSVLVLLEAPLTEYFDNNGNPDRRFQGENHRWYVNAGATVSLAGMFFLDRLARNLGHTPASIYLAEICSTNKPKKACDACEAEAIGSAVRAGNVGPVALNPAARPLKPDVVAGAPPVFVFNWVPRACPRNHAQL